MDSIIHNEIKNREERLRLRRTFYYISIVTLLVPLFSYLAYGQNIISRNSFLITAIVFGFISISLFLWSYLWAAPFYPDRVLTASDEISQIRAMIFRLERTAQDIEFLETSQTAITPDGIAVIRAHAEQVFSNLKYSRATIDLDVNFSADLLETRVGRQITINKISQILNFLRERISLISNENRDSQREAQRSQENSLLIGNRINSRLQAEINALSKRATIYIIIGGIIALAGGVYLYVSAQEVVNLIKENSNLSANFREIAYREIPPLILRLSVVIFVEIFAFYFLKLHKDAMESIRYYQNELTNIDLKTIALNAAYSTSDGECLEGVIKELSITERNFILKGKQTTVEIEKRKFDKYLVTEALDRLTILLKKKD